MQSYEPQADWNKTIDLRLNSSFASAENSKNFCRSLDKLRQNMLAGFVLDVLFAPHISLSLQYSRSLRLSPCNPAGIRVVTFLLIVLVRHPFHIAIVWSDLDISSTSRRLSMIREFSWLVFPQKRTGVREKAWSFPPLRDVMNPVPMRARDLFTLTGLSGRRGIRSESIAQC